MVDVNRIKLVIWDLDDTFWEGTLSEGGVKPIAQNVNFIRDLVDHGIMNSICSKNDFSRTKEVLVQMGAWENFVFPSIDWTPKAARVKSIVQTMALRPANCLFVDDNELNLNEVKFYLPEIQVLHAGKLPFLMEQMSCLGKWDKEHKRLLQYRILEKKEVDKNKVDSASEFLQQSDVRVWINIECARQLDRIAEMVERTNQLNYTKLRSSREELAALMQDEDYECATVEVKDRYGDYGIVGFYALNKQRHELKHFLFSCRTMGMGIEQYIYEQLSFPDLKVIGEVVNQLRQEKVVDWVRPAKGGLQVETGMKRDHETESVIRVLVKGPCDLDSVIPYLQIGRGVQIRTEFNTVNSEGVAITAFNTTTHIVESQTLKEKEKEELLFSAPFLDQSVFETTLFSESWDVVFLSLLPDGHEGVYRHQKSGHRICFTSALVDITSDANREFMLDGYHPLYTHGFHFSSELLDNFKQSFRYEGFITPEDVVSNLRFIRTHLNQKTLLVLMLPSEVEHEHTKDRIWRNHAENHKNINQAVREAFESYSNIRLINYTDYITSQKCYADTINHFSREVYFQLSNDIIQIINEFGKGLVVMKSKDVLDEMERKKRKQAIRNRVKYLISRAWRLMKTGK